MLRNPDNLSAEEYLTHLHNTHGDNMPSYVQFGVEERRRNVICHVLYRAIQMRDELVLTEDFCWHFNESPEWLTS